MGHTVKLPWAVSDQGYMLYSLCFKYPYRHLEQTVTLNKTTEIANATACLFTASQSAQNVEIMFPKVLEFMWLLRILAPVLNDTAYSGDDSFTRSRRKDCTSCTTSPLWLTAVMLPQGSCASRFSQQLQNKQRRSGMEKWFTGIETKREPGDDAKLSWRQNFYSFLLKMCRQHGASLWCVS